MDGGRAEPHERVSVASLHAFCIRLCEAAGMPVKDAATLATFLVEQDVVQGGRMSHGTRCLAGVAATDRPGWQDYLRRNGMTPALLGAGSWDGVMPCGRADAGALAPGASEVNSTGSRLVDRRRFYWTVRFSVWDAARYVSDWTAAYAQAWSPDLGMFVNFNK